MVITELQDQASKLDLKALKTTSFISWTPQEFTAKWRANIGKVVKIKFNHTTTYAWSIGGDDEVTLGLSDIDGGCVPVIYADSASDFMSKLPTKEGRKSFFIYALVMKDYGVYLLGRDIQQGKVGYEWVW